MTQEQLTNKLENIIRNFYSKNIEKEGYDINGFVKYVNKKKSNGKKILEDTGRLKSKIKNPSINENKLGFSFDYNLESEYEYVNENRPFIYESETLDKLISNEINNYINDQLK